MFEESELNNDKNVISKVSNAVIWAPDLCDKNCCGVVITNQRVFLCCGGHKGWKCFQLIQLKEKGTIRLMMTNGFC